MLKHFLCLLLTFLLLVRELLLSAVVAQPGITQTIATLSEARYYLAGTSSQEFIFFAGGYNETKFTGPSNRVDICNVTSGTWTTATLSVPRADLAAVSSGNLVFFAGGWDFSTPYDQVDIYNISDGRWSTATLSQARFDLAATSVGNLVLFGGGYNHSFYFDIVDIYNVTSNTWTTATLSQSRAYLAATSVANRYALFAGGYNGTVASKVVDIFDSLSRTWNTTTLIQGASAPAAASLGNLTFIGGGDSGNASHPFNTVNIFNATSQTWSTATLSQNRTWLAAASIEDIVAFGGGTPDGGANYSAVVDMYNATSNIWFTTSLSQPRGLLAAASSTNKIFFGGGNSSCSGGVSNFVDIFDIPLPPPPPTPSSSVCSTPTNAASSLTLSACSTMSSTVSGPSSPSTAMSALPSQLNASTLHSTPQTNNVLVGILIGSLIGALLLVGGIFVLLLLLRKKRKNKKLKNDRNNEDFLIKTQRKATVVLESGTNTVTSNETNTTMTIYQSRTETLKRLTDFQIPFNELETGKEIGEGTYGRVCIGKWKKYRVAVKFCQNRGKMEEFMREANLMISLPPHPNVVRMYGLSIDGTQPVIVMEYCAGGSLDKWLYDQRQQISDQQKIRWVHEIAMGMSHLHKHNIVHRDLAARNILLSQPNLANAQPKIADFGMSRVLQQNSEGKTLTSFGPLRWMAPESLRERVYSKKSDVWMFGMLVYEIAARCEPYINVPPDKIAVLIRDEGLTPTIPSNCPQKLRELMQMCWKKQPEQRPNFETICLLLEQ